MLPNVGISLAGSYKNNPNDVSRLIDSLNIPLRPDLKEVNINFSLCCFFDAHLCSLLGSYIDKWRRQGINVIYNNMSSAISNIFKKNGFMSFYFKQEQAVDTYGTTTPFIRFDNTHVSDVEFTEYLYDKLLNKDIYNDITDEEKDLIVTCLTEIFSNTTLHSKSISIYTCGQYFPNRAENKELCFTIADSGVGFKENVSQKLSSDIFDDARSIEWALEKGNTTRNTEGAPGGLGLYQLSKFVERNQSSMMIISGEAILHIEKNNNRKSYKLATPYSGTIVILNTCLQNLV